LNCIVILASGWWLQAIQWRRGGLPTSHSKIRRLSRLRFTCQYGYKLWWAISSCFAGLKLSSFSNKEDQITYNCKQIISAWCVTQIIRNKKQV
jgi:hypothetical protein